MTKGNAESDPATNCNAFCNPKTKRNSKMSCFED
jgi:hypothetical protein